MQSIYPLVGKPSSNIRIRRISSVRSRRPRISFTDAENSSVAALDAAYSVLHLSDTAWRTRSNPSFASNLKSMLDSVPFIYFRSDRTLRQAAV